MLRSSATERTAKKPLSIVYIRTRSTAGVSLTAQLEGEAGELILRSTAVQDSNLPGDLTRAESGQGREPMGPYDTLPARESRLRNRQRIRQAPSGVCGRIHDRAKTGDADVG